AHDRPRHVGPPAANARPRGRPRDLRQTPIPAPLEASVMSWELKAVLSYKRVEPDINHPERAGQSSGEPNPALTALLADDWEPFAVAFGPVIWLRRQRPL